MKPWEQGRIIPQSGSVNHSELGAKTKLFRVCGVRKHPQTNQGLAKGRRLGGTTQKKKKAKNDAAHAHQLAGSGEKPTKRGKFGIPIFILIFFFLFLFLLFSFLLDAR